MDLKQHKTKKGSIAIKSFFIFLAVNLIGLAVALILESGLGCEPIGLLCDGVAHALSIPFGRGCFIYNLLSGFFIDFYGDILLGFALGQQDILIAVIVFAVGELMMAAAFALLMELKLGMTALDAFLVKIEELLHIPYAFLKIGMDICFVITGYLLGGTFGIGTIVSAILTGILVKQWAKIFGWLKKEAQGIYARGGESNYEEV